MNTDVIQKITKDGKYRITVRIDECAENPLDCYDFQLHVSDWDRDYSLRERKCNENESARQLLERLVRNYGDYDKIIETLIRNGKSVFHDAYDTALIYDRKKQEMESEILD